MSDLDSGRRAGRQAVPRQRASEGAGGAGDQGWVSRTSAAHPGNADIGSEAAGLPSRAARRRAQRRNARSRRTALIVVGLVIALAAAGFAGVSILRPVVGQLFSGEVSDYPGPGTGSVEVTINPGDSGRAIAANLEEAGVVASSGAFVDALEANPGGGTLQPGIYQVREEMKASEALALLLSPDSKMVQRVTVREGLWVSEVLPQISEATGISLAELEAASKDAAGIGLPAEADGDPEGYLFPATYEFDPGTTATQALAAMVRRHDQAMESLAVPQEQRRDLLIRASIVQAETGNNEADMAKVATVIQNRLDDGNQTLGMDSTVGYVLQKRLLDLTAEDLETNSPYNTRLVEGLPPGPIGNPGEAAIEAVLNPEPGDWLWFVTVDPDAGETVFTDDYNEFLRAKQQYQEWLEQNQ